MLHSIAAQFIRPLVKSWWPTARSSWRRQRPTETRAHSRGINADRVLLVGHGVAVGFGVLTQDLALSGQLAKAVTARTGRAADVEVVAHMRMNARTCREALHYTRLDRYDAIVITLGMNEALTLVAPSRWERDLDEICSAIEAEHIGCLPVLLVGIPAIETVTDIPRVFSSFARRHAELLNERTQRVASRHPGVTYVPFSPCTEKDVRFGSSATYANWADLIAPSLATQLARAAEHRVYAPQYELERQFALDAMGILDTGPDARFDSITASARNLFGTSAAAITFIDRDRMWVKSAVGVAARDSPRITSFCNTTIQRPDVYVVGNTAEATFFTERPMAHEPYNRFYAGFPIESQDGQRIGALCIIDGKPRVFTDADAALLRDLAKQVQQVLWSTAPAGSRRIPALVG